MAKIKMVATKDMRYSTRRLTAGDVFDARSTMDARVLRATNKARDWQDVPKPEPEVVEKIEESREKSELDELREEADAMGLEYSPRMREPGLRKLIDDAKDA